MAVRIQNMQGAKPPVTSFSDNFVRPATTFGAGEDYISGPQPGVIESVGNLIFTDGVSFAIRASSVNRNDRTSIVFWPKVIVPNVAANQFAQATLLADNSVSGTATLQGGLFLLAGWQTGNNGYRDYSIGWEGPSGGPNANSIFIRRMNGPSSETVIAGPTASGTASVNDVLRAEVTVLPASNEIDVLINGVSILTFSDVSALRPGEGQPGLGRLRWISGAAPGNRTVRLGNFSAGLL